MEIMRSGGCDVGEIEEVRKGGMMRYRGDGVYLNEVRMLCEERERGWEV